MRIYLLFCFLITSLTASFAQQQAVITGDTMLCSGGQGTAMVQGIVPYDSYQWQVKAYLTTEFVDIEGATSSTFTYDAYTYSVSYIRCEVSQNGETFYSNELFIDSMVSLPIFYSSDVDGPVTINPENGGYLICPGGTITNSIMGGTSYQWFKDDEPISGANSATYVVTGPGVYYAAVTLQCEGFTYTLPQEVVANPNCSPGGLEPIIAGDTMLCPEGNGTAEVTNETEYDTYQWQVKFAWEDDAAYTDVEGATSASFTYDQYNYSVTNIRVRVTLDGETYYSNVLSIDSHVFAGLIVEHTTSGQVGTDPETGAFLLCGDAASISNMVNQPYVIVQWYKDGQPIEGATNPTYVITEPGQYHVTGSPEICPDFVMTLDPFTVALDPNCTAGTETPDTTGFTLYPNPANSTLNISLPNGSGADSYTIIDVTGKTLMGGALSGTTPSINIQVLAQGSYIIKVSGHGAQTSKMFVKQ